MPRGRLFLLLGLLAFALTFRHDLGAQPAVPPPGDADEKLLRNAGLPVDGPGLVEFFRKRSLKAADRKGLEDLIKKLDDRSYRIRNEASKELILRGSLALPFLKQALKGGSLELSRRAEECIKKIEAGPGPEQPAAAARLLTVRQPKEAVEALFDYVVHVDDEWLEDEVLTSIGTLVLRQGRIDLLRSALKDDAPERRGVAAYILAQRCSVENREAVRRLLADPDPNVRTRAAGGLAGKRSLQSPQANAAADEAMLRSANVERTGTSLVKFFEKRSLDDTAQTRLRHLIRQLGDRAWAARERATRELITQGVPALPFLKQAVEDESPEVAARATDAIRKIKQGPGPSLPIAAARVLARSGEPQPGKPEAEPPGAVPPAKAIEALLTYIPFADDETVEDEVLTSLTLLSVRSAEVDPLFVSALHDPLPPRRAAAAYVLGRTGSKADCQRLGKLLDDPVLKVRLRAAQGLLAARDRAAVPALIDLLGKAPDGWMWRVEETLQRLAGERPPEVPATDNLAEFRKKAVVAWNGWWRQNESHVDLTRALADDQRLGLTTIVEYDSTVGNRQGRVWECGRDGKPRWELRNLFGPMDAQVLPSGRLLVAENNASRVTERDIATGNIVWQHNVPNPVACVRLANGNTFIASYNGLVEVTPAKNVVWSHNLTPNFFVFGAKRMRSGLIVCVTSQGILLEFDPATKRQVRTINMGAQGNWCGVDVLPNGRYLVALMNVNEIREIDHAGTVHWRANFPGVFRAERLPNGNTLAVSMTTKRIAEIDRTGRAVWEKLAQGRPWMAHAR